MRVPVRTDRHGITYYANPAKLEQEPIEEQESEEERDVAGAVLFAMFIVGLIVAYAAIGGALGLEGL